MKSKGWFSFHSNFCDKLCAQLIQWGKKTFKISNNKFMNWKKNMEKFTGTNSDGESIWSFWIICLYAWMSVCIGLMKHWILCTKSGKSFSQNLGSEYYMVVCAINHHTFIIRIVFTNNFTLFPFDNIQLVVQPCNIYLTSESNFPDRNGTNRNSVIMKKV